MGRWGLALDLDRPRTVTRMRFVAPPGDGARRAVQRGQDDRPLRDPADHGQGAMEWSTRRAILCSTGWWRSRPWSRRAAAASAPRRYLQRLRARAKAAPRCSNRDRDLFDVGWTTACRSCARVPAGESLAPRLYQVRIAARPRGSRSRSTWAARSSFAPASESSTATSSGQRAARRRDPVETGRLRDRAVCPTRPHPRRIFMATRVCAVEANQPGALHARPVFAWGRCSTSSCPGVSVRGAHTRTTTGYVLKTTASRRATTSRLDPEPLADV